METFAAFARSICVLGAACLGLAPVLGIAEDSEGQAGIHVVAQLVQKSPIPDPKKSDYEDCLYTAQVKVLQITSKARVPRDLILILPAFTKRALQPESKYEEGSVIEADLLPHEKADKDRRTMQRSDLLDRFDLHAFDALSSRLSTHSAASFPSRSDDYFEAAPAEEKAHPAEAAPVHYPSSERAAAERKAAMDHDRETIASALKAHGGSWEKWQDEVSPMLTDLVKQIDASKEKALRKNNLFYLGPHLNDYKQLGLQLQADDCPPVRVLKFLSKQLRERGIDLIVVPFPYREDVIADSFSTHAPSDGWFVPQRMHFIQKLLEADVEVIDLVQPLRAGLARYPVVFHDTVDQHPCDGGVQVAADEIAKRLARYEVEKPSPALKFNLKQVTYSDNDRQYAATAVTTEKGEPLDVPENAGSPFIVMGDSFSRTPDYHPGGEGAAIPMHVAYRLGVVPDYLGAMGNSDKVMRLLARQGGNYLANRKAVVFVFAPNRLFGAESYSKRGGTWNLVDLPPLPIER